MHGNHRAAVNLVDVFLGLGTLVALMVLAPVIYRFADMVQPEADPLSQLLLSLLVPMLFISMIVSVGISARGGA